MITLHGNRDLNIKRTVLFGRYQAMITLEIRRASQMLDDAQARRINAIEAVVSDVTEAAAWAVMLLGATTRSDHAGQVCTQTPAPRRPFMDLRQSARVARLAPRR
ncbi:hypothetical protein L2D01_05960 [Hyphomonadaceae bacterium ML37]|nr:hypothetical protein L2D01_05960 [Hyphomonadaceae bacterium ML37]